MKKALFFLLLLAVICVMPSCKKMVAIHGIAFGDTSHMIVTPTNDTIDYLHHEKNFDFDDDGISDLMISLSQPGAASGHWDKFTAKSMAVTKLLGKQVELEKYIHSETSYSTSDDGNVVIVKHDNYYTCNPMADSDSLYEKKDTFVLLANAEGDMFKLDDEYADTEATIFEQSYNSPGGYEHTADTTEFWTNHNLNDCTNFPLDTPVYIGFMFSYNGKTRLGWVKILVDQNSLVVVETALQK